MKSKQKNDCMVPRLICIVLSIKCVFQMKWLYEFHFKVCVELFYPEVYLKRVPGRFAPNPVRPLSRFAPISVRPGSFRPYSRSPWVVSPRFINKSQKLTILFKLWTNKNHSYKHNEQINNQNIDNSECFGVKLVKIYPEMTSQ